MGIAELDQAGALGMHGDGPVDADRPKFIGLALGGPQREVQTMLNGCGRRLGDSVSAFNR
jgi:hypothetical protein